MGSYSIVTTLQSLMMARIKHTGNIRKMGSGIACSTMWPRESTLPQRSTRQYVQTSIVLLDEQGYYYYMLVHTDAYGYARFIDRFYFRRALTLTTSSSTSTSSHYKQARTAPPARYVRLWPIAMISIVCWARQRSVILSQHGSGWTMTTCLRLMGHESVQALRNLISFIW